VARNKSYDFEWGLILWGLGCVVASCELIVEKAKVIQHQQAQQQQQFQQQQVQQQQQFQQQQVQQQQQFQQQQVQQQRQQQQTILVQQSSTEVYKSEESTMEQKSMAPSFSSLPIRTPNQTIEVEEGKLLRLDCRVSGRPAPEVSWYLNNAQLRDDSTHKVLVNEQGSHSLMITSVTRNDQGGYL
jgi:hypothetical protein